jgi:thymidylate synthase (FAD)
MTIEFVSMTGPNLANLDGDAMRMFDGKGTFAENLCEYAGRVCYASTAKMGYAPGFLVDRVREGHEDIIEHVVVTMRLDEWSSWQHPRAINRHCETYSIGDGYHISANLRVWLDFFRRGYMLDAMAILTAIAPSVFAEFGAVPDALSLPAVNVRPTTWGWQRVTMLGANLPDLPADDLLHHGSATFLFEGISLACTHQLVRHRLGSFSQLSRRYVDIDKAEWDAITPPAIARNPEAAQRMRDFYAKVKFEYEQLRRLGIRKEDARFLLPVATETRIVTTMNFAAWSHFLWLRAVDKAAQWEIRAMGQQVLEQLCQIAPDVFAEHMAKMEEMADG